MNSIQRPFTRAHAIALLTIATAMFCQSCRVIGGIFKAGVWVGVVAVVVVLAIVGGTLALFRRA